MNVSIWYPADYVADSVPFYVPIRAIVTDKYSINDQKSYTYEWSFNNNLFEELYGVAQEVDYEAYIKDNICSLVVYKPGLIRATVVVTDNDTGETGTAFCDILTSANAINLYSFDTNPGASYYDEKYLTEYDDTLASQPAGYDLCSGDSYIHFGGEFTFKTWDSEYDYSQLLDEVRELLHRTIQPDQMWERYYMSDCKCVYAISDPIETYFPNKIDLLQLLTCENGIRYYIKVKPTSTLQTAVGRLYQALRFVINLKGIELPIQKYDVNSDLPILKYDPVLDDLDSYVTSSYNSVKGTIDSEYVFEIVESDVISFLNAYQLTCGLELEEMRPEFPPDIPTLITDLEKNEAGVYDGSSDTELGTKNILAIENGGTGTASPNEFFDNIGLHDYIATTMAGRYMSEEEIEEVFEKGMSKA